MLRPLRCMAWRAPHHRYRPDAAILQGVCFRVPAGTSCAVVGASGSGKSTVLRLLFRFYDTEGGAVLVGGRDVRSLQLAALRRAMASVPQDMVLFNESIYYNIAYGNLDAPRSDVEAAAKAAQVRVHACVLTCVRACVVGCSMMHTAMSRCSEKTRLLLPGAVVLILRCRSTTPSCACLMATTPWWASAASRCVGVCVVVCVCGCVGVC